MKKRTWFFTTRSLEDEGEGKFEEIFVNICGLDFWKYRQEPSLLSKFILESHLDEIINYIEYHKHQQLKRYQTSNDKLKIREGIDLLYALAYQILAILILETGSILPDKVKNEVLRATIWDFDKRWGFSSAYIEPRKNYLKYLRNAILNYNSGKKVLFVDSPELKILNKGKEATIIEGLEGLFDNIVRAQEVTRLDLSNCNLKSIPEEVFFFTNLRELYLSGNKLREIPSDIKVLQNLEVLDLSHNDFESFPEVVVELSSLEVLDLIKNRISEIPESILCLDNLYYLHLGGNPVDFVKLHSLLPDIYIGYPY